jgi:hypothetical protein
MSTTALTGKDTIQINGRILNDFADGDVAKLSFPNKLVEVKTGKNGNSIYAFNYTGRQAEMELRILRGSSDDKFLNNLLSLFTYDPSAFTLLTGTFSKNVGDGIGGYSVVTYIMSGGAFQKQVDVLENADGSTDQAVAVYSLIFSNAPSAIGG